MLSSELNDLISAAKRGDLASQHRLGMLYLNGQDIEQDYQKAVEWITKAAEAGYSISQCQLGYMYDVGLGLPQDYKKAVEYYQKSAAQGNIDGQYNLATVYVSGRGVELDYVQAVFWYRKAADQGDKDAQYGLGLRYEFGQGVPVDFSLAFMWFLRSAGQGHLKAKCKVAELYRDGRGVAQDYAEAVKWFSDAAYNGDADAQYELGLMHEIGLGISRDSNTAAAWYKRSGDQGHKEALARLFAMEKLQESATDPQTGFPKESPGIVINESGLAECFQELNNLVGLPRVKSELYDLMQFVRIREMRKSQGLETRALSLHSVFYGAAGTGKTTVARIYGKMLRAMGLLTSGHVVETDRSGLVAGYIGQTSLKTDEKIKESLGGVLFIDEAYALYKHDSGWDFGNEAVEILMKRMEDYRDNFVVIVAGYRQPMESFLHSNEGLKSRFSTYLEFEDYTPDELLEIFRHFCSKENYTVNEEALRLVSIAINQEFVKKDESFGNARFIRNMFEKLLRNQARRIAETITKPTREDLSRILEDDIKPLLPEDAWKNVSGKHLHIV